MELQNARTILGGLPDHRAKFIAGAPVALRLMLLLSLFATPVRASEPGSGVRMMEAEPTTAVEAYDLGVAKLELGDLKGAEAAFKKSGALAGKLGIDFAPPHEGMARVLLKKNKLIEADFEGRTATELDPAWLRGWWVLGKVAEREKNDEMALVYYERGLLIDLTDEELGSAAVDLLRRLGREQGALALENRQRAAQRAEAGRANPEMAVRPTAAATEPVEPDTPAEYAEPDPFANARRRLAPFRSDEDPLDEPALLAVFAQETLTRGALAVLITGNGKSSLSKALDAEAGLLDGSFRTPNDVTGRPEAYWINRALTQGLMETLPDGSFRPDQPVTRQTLSLWAEETISRLRGNSKVFSLYKGTPTPFSDLKSTHYAYNAARIAVDLKMIAPGPNGEFEPDRPLSIDEGVAAVRNFVPALVGARGE